MSSLRTTQAVRGSATRSNVPGHRALQTKPTHALEIHRLRLAEPRSFGCSFIPPVPFAVSRQQLCL
jgi:hypothetical protein